MNNKDRKLTQTLQGGKGVLGQYHKLQVQSAHSVNYRHTNTVIVDNRFTKPQYI